MNTVPLLLAAPWPSVARFRESRVEYDALSGLGSERQKQEREE